MSKYLSSSVEETKKISLDLLNLAIARNSLGATIIALDAELGAGKTQIAQSIAAHLGIKRSVTSPTFVLMKKYNIENSSSQNIKKIYHFDCYRVHSEQEILDLEWEQIISDDKSLIIVEWPNKIKNIIPQGALWVKIISRGENIRELSVIT